MNSFTNESVNFDEMWSYPLQWMGESEPARDAYQRFIWRSTLAKQGRPCRNTYQEELKSNLAKARRDIQDKYKDRCENVPEGRSFALKKAVDNIASQMSGGVDTYEYHINDPYMIIDADTEDLLSAKCEQDYVENKVELLSPVFSDDIMWYGMAAVVVKYDPLTDKNKVLRIHPKNCWFDTKYSSMGQERFRGYSTMISWAKLKKMIESDGDEVNLTIKAPDSTFLDEIKETKEGKESVRYNVNKTAKMGKRKIRSLNGLDIYVDTMNKLATSPTLSGMGDIIHYYGEYDHDLHTCYNLSWYHSFAQSGEERTNNGYNGDDVELTVMYDLDRKIEFKIINRRYVISANSKAFKRVINYTWTDPRTLEPVSRLDDFYLDCPLKFAYETLNNMDTAPHPWSTVFSLLDSHDELCGWRARREHVSKILSILRIDTNGADAESLVGLMNIMGGVYDNLQGDVTSLSLAYDYTPIDSEIEHLETVIQQVLHAYDQFDALQAMGDRASATESGQATFAVAQGLVVHQQALMGLFADIARQCIENRVAYSSRQEFPVLNAGGYRSITIQQMALTAVINVKSKLALEAKERQTATNALSILGSMGKAFDLSNEGAGWLMNKALYGVLPRKMAETFVNQKIVSDQELALSSTLANNDANMLRQNQQMYEQNPIPYETENIMANSSPEDIQAITQGINADTALREQEGAGGLDAQLQAILNGAGGGQGGQGGQGGGGSDLSAVFADDALGANGFSMSGTNPEVGGEMANLDALM